MVKPCPGCGAAAVPQARFCRLCGTPLRVGSARDDETPVSPLAQTIPLSGEGRATDGLGADDARRPASDTSKVGRAEMENLLRRAGPTRPRHEADGDAERNGAQTTTLAARATATAADAPPPPTPALGQANASSRRRWQAAAVALLCVALVAGVLAFVLSRRSNQGAADGSSPISISDQQQLVGEKLAEAETLLGSGEFNRAVTVLRAAAKLDPANAEVRMRLGNALERTGARDEAIAEYRAATESSPGNAAAWLALASAQYEEKAYSEAADSYRRSIEASGAADADDETRLAYADALRLAGRADEARNAYQKISGSTSGTVAQTARARLAELGPPPATAAANAERTRAGEQEEQASKAEGAEQPSSSPSPVPTPQPTATTATAATEARVDYDAYFLQAVSIVNGRDPKTIERAELLRALALFQKAALGGSHRGEAQRYADRLGKEYDRRRKL